MLNVLFKIFADSPSIRLVIVLLRFGLKRLLELFSGEHSVKFTCERS